MRKILVIIYLLFLVLQSCRNTGLEASRQLLQADALMSVAPDSSLAILNAVDTALFDESRKAHYALLLTKARDKNYIFDSDDSMIRRAFSHYEDAGDSLEIQSWFYEGVALNQAGRYGEAIYVLTEAFDKAVVQENWFYAGMCARDLSQVSKMIYYPEDELKWACIARDMFRRSDHQAHAAWMDPTIIAALTYNGKFQEAIELAESVDKKLFERDWSFRRFVVLAKIEALSKMSRYKDVIVEYDSLLKAGYVNRVYDHIKLAESYMHVGQLTASQHHLSEAVKLPKCTADTLYYMNIASQLSAAHGDWQTAYNIAKEWRHFSVRNEDSLITNRHTALAAEVYRTNSRLKRAELEKSRMELTCWVVGSVLTVLLLLFVILFLKKRLENRKLQVDRYIQELSTLKEDLSKQIDEIEVSHSKRSDKFSKDIRDLFSKHIRMLDSICDLKYNDSIKRECDGAALRKGILKAIEGNTEYRGNGGTDEDHR